MPETAHTPILIVGVQRSGTTWFSRVLSSTPGTHYLHEPDNEKQNPFALYLKQRLHRFPYLRAGDEVPDFEALWQWALYGAIPPRLLDVVLRRVGPLVPAVAEDDVRRRCDGNASGERSARWNAGQTRWQRWQISLTYTLARVAAVALPSDGGRRLVKSVHSILALRWIERKFNVPLVLVRRHPFAVAASYLRLGLPDADRNIFAQTHFVEDCIDPAMADAALRATQVVERLGYQLAAVERFLEMYLRDRPRCLVVEHDALCADPVAEFEAVFHRLQLPWTPAVEKAIADSNRPGRGFKTERLRHEEIGKWKRELDTNQLRILERCFSVAGVAVR